MEGYIELDYMEGAYASTKEVREALRDLEEKIIALNPSTFEQFIKHEEIDPRLIAAARFAIGLFSKASGTHYNGVRIIDFVETARLAVDNYEKRGLGLCRDDVRAMQKIILPAYSVHEEKMTERAKQAELN